MFASELENKKSEKNVDLPFFCSPLWFLSVQTFFVVMEFVEYIKSPKIDKVSLRRRGQAYLEGTLCVTGHHLIFSSRTDHKDELIVSIIIIFIVLCNFFSIS